MRKSNHRTNWQLEKEWDASSIVSNLESNYFSVGVHRKITGIASIDRAGENDLAFCSWEGEQAISIISKSKAGIILCSKRLKGLVTPRPQSQLVFLENPRLVFVRFVNTSRKNEFDVDVDVEISPTAKIAPAARIGSNCKVGDFVRIGRNCIIHDNAIIEDRVTLVQNVTVGQNCIIQSGVTIGSDGFAYERHSDGRLERFPHLGGVTIEKNVEICANSSIARGSLSDTIIGEGTKIDALVHIAHNVCIGRNCQLAAGTIIGGSTEIGDSCWTGLNSTLKNKIKIGNNVLVGAGACVISDVSEGDIVAGVPAKSIKKKASSNELFIMAGQKNS